MQFRNEFLYLLFKGDFEIEGFMEVQEKNMEVDKEIAFSSFSVLLFSFLSSFLQLLSDLIFF